MFSVLDFTRNAYEIEAWQGHCYIVMVIYSENKITFSKIYVEFWYKTRIRSCACLSSSFLGTQGWILLLLVVLQRNYLFKTSRPCYTRHFFLKLALQCWSCIVAKSRRYSTFLATFVWNKLLRGCHAHNFFYNLSCNGVALPVRVFKKLNRTV
jgi:hypothetical protein